MRHVYPPSWSEAEATSRLLIPCSRLYLCYRLLCFGRDVGGFSTGTDGHTRLFKLLILFFFAYLLAKDGKMGRHISLLSQDRL